MRLTNISVSNGCMTDCEHGRSIGITLARHNAHNQRKEIA
jgi:hypothetical protein